MQHTASHIPKKKYVLTCIQATDRRHTPGYSLFDQKKLRHLRSQYVPNKKTGPTQRKLVASHCNNTHKKQHFHYQQQKTKM